LAVERARERAERQEKNISILSHQIWQYNAFALVQRKRVADKRASPELIRYKDGGGTPTHHATNALYPTHPVSGERNLDRLYLAAVRLSPSHLNLLAICRNQTVLSLVSEFIFASTVPCFSSLISTHDDILPSIEKFNCL
jgi:hypothetical protein